MTRALNMNKPKALTTLSDLNKFTLKLIFFLVILIQSPLLLAEQKISLSQAIDLTVKNHLDLTPYSHQSDALKAMVNQAKVGTPMSLDVNIEDVLGTGNLSGISGMQTTVNVTWMLEKDIINSRTILAQKKSELTSLAKANQINHVIANISTYFYTLLAQTEEMKLAKLVEIRANQALEKISERVKVGSANSIDELRARANLYAKKLVVEDLQHEIEVSKEKLAAQWQGQTNFELQGNFSDIPTEEEITVNANILRENPTFKQFAANESVIDSEIDHAAKTAKPPWKISTGIRRNESFNDFGFVASLSIPLGSENRNKSLINALHSEKLQQQSLAQAWYQSTVTEILETTHKLKHNIHVAESLKNEVIPVLKSSDDKAKRAYEVGNMSYTELYVIQQEFLEAQLSLIEATKEIHLLRIELERLTGVAVSEKQRKS